METTPVYRIGGKGRPKGCRVPRKKKVPRRRVLNNIKHGGQIGWDDRIPLDSML